MTSSDVINQKQAPNNSLRPRVVRDTVEFSVKGPVSVNFDEEVLAPGCSVLDILFTSPSSVRELVFRNYYTAWLTLLVRVSSKDQPMSGKCSATDAAWILGIAHRKLMPFPHLEDGSQDLVSILATESLVEWQHLVAIRLVLRQPSALWKTFHVEELNVYNDLPRRIPSSQVPLVNTDSSKSPPHVQKFGSLLALVREQTRASLSFSHRHQDTQECSTANKDNAQMGYEFFNLPQI